VQPIAWVIAILDAPMIVAMIVIMVREEGGGLAKPGRRRQRARLSEPQ
jgi:hypothetical protein